jgi:hypothetical protein
MTTYEKTGRRCIALLRRFSDLDTSDLEYLAVRLHPDDFREAGLTVHPEDRRRYPVLDECELLVHGVRVVVCSGTPRL